MLRRARKQQFEVYVVESLRTAHRFAAGSVLETLQSRTATRRARVQGGIGARQNLDDRTRYHLVLRHLRRLHRPVCCRLPGDQPGQALRQLVLTGGNRPASDGGFSRFSSCLIMRGFILWPPAQRKS